MAAINGVAAGSGYQVSLLCDVRVIHPGVTMGQTEVSSGIPSITGLYLTERALGRSRTLEMMLTGRLLDADELCHVGLAHHLVPASEVVDRAVAVAAQIARQPTVAVQATSSEPGSSSATDSGRRSMRPPSIDQRAWASGQPQQTMRAFFEARGAPALTAAAGPGPEPTVVSLLQDRTQAARLARYLRSDDGSDVCFWSWRRGWPPPALSDSGWASGAGIGSP